MSNENVKRNSSTIYIVIIACLVFLVVALASQSPDANSRDNSRNNTTRDRVIVARNLELIGVVKCMGIYEDASIRNIDNAPRIACMKRRGVYRAFLGVFDMNNG